MVDWCICLPPRCGASLRASCRMARWAGIVWTHVCTLCTPCDRWWWGMSGVCVGAEQILYEIRASLLPRDTVWVCGASKNMCYISNISHSPSLAFILQGAGRDCDGALPIFRRRFEWTGSCNGSAERAETSACLLYSAFQFSKWFLSVHKHFHAVWVIVCARCVSPPPPQVNWHRWGYRLNLTAQWPTEVGASRDNNAPTEATIGSPLPLQTAKFPFSKKWENRVILLLQTPPLRRGHCNLPLRSRNMRCLLSHWFPLA